MTSTKKNSGMKTWTVSIYRRKSALDNHFEFSRNDTVEARTETAAWNKAERIWNNPYQYVRDIKPELK